MCRLAKNLVFLFVLGQLCILSTPLSFWTGRVVNCGAHVTRRAQHYTWTGTNVRFPSEGIRHAKENNGDFIRKNSIQTKFQYYPPGREVIMTMPRYKEGIPVTLARVDFSRGHNAPSFFPYPNWEMQQVGNKSAIQSAVDIAIDPLHRLYVLDSGVVSTLCNANRTSAPKVIVIDMITNRVLRTIDLSSVSGTDCEVQNMAVEVTMSGLVYIYVGDTFNNRILVWDVQNNKGHRVQLPEQVLDGCSSGPDVLYLQLSRISRRSRVLYFTHFCSKNLYSVDTQTLQKGKLGNMVVAGEKPAGTVLLGTDKRSTMFLRHGWNSTIYQWDTNTAFSSKNFVVAHEGDQCRMTTAVAPAFNLLMFGLDSNFEDYVWDSVGCLGPTVSLFPLIKPCPESRRECFTCAVV